MSVGSELLTGITINTNAYWLSRIITEASANVKTKKFPRTSMMKYLIGGASAEEDDVDYNM